MRPALQSLWIVGATLAGVAALLAGRPFETAQHALDRCFASGPAWTQVTKLLTDPSTQEVSHGENPSQSLATLSAQWSKDAGAARVVFIGNSQMFAVSLAPGEPAPKDPEKTYPDLVAEALGSEHNHCYRLAAPGMSYTEALWYTNYLAASGKLRPSSIVLQLNYQSLWNGGVRDGMLEMLDTPEFFDTIQKLAISGRPYSDDLADALRRYTRRKERVKAGAKGAGEPAGLAGPVLGRPFESSVRGALEILPVWTERLRHRSNFYDMLYSARIYLLQIKPSTARSINGSRLWRSQAALEDVAKICQVNGVRLILFNAPVNPGVSLYQTAADLERYRQFISTLTTDYHLQVHDLENTIPKELWGTWMNGPDPLHLGRQGHRLMAHRIVRVLEQGLER